MGYRKGEDGLPEIVPEEAEIVRSIYRMCMEGKSTNAIAKYLTEEGIPTPAGKEVWQRATVESVLKNEKYKGSTLLQKKFTVDFLQKKMKINEGEVPQYYVEHSTNKYRRTIWQCNAKFHNEEKCRTPTFTRMI